MQHEKDRRSPVSAPYAHPLPDAADLEGEGIVKFEHFHRQLIRHFYPGHPLAEPVGLAFRKHAEIRDACAELFLRVHRGPERRRDAHDKQIQRAVEHRLDGVPVLVRQISILFAVVHQRIADENEHAKTDASRVIPAGHISTVKSEVFLPFSLS